MEDSQISIIVPCYNSEDTLEKCVSCLINQRVKPYEVILVDDGSVDNTSVMCDMISETFSIVKVIHQENVGLVGAWQNGVNYAKGDYVGFCDSDDYLEDDYIVRLLQVIETYKADVIIYGGVEEKKNGVIEKHINRLESGYYSRREIADKILPFYFYNDSTDRGHVSESRNMCLVKKDVMKRAMHYISRGISLGEDQSTAFAAIMICNSLYIMDGYYPYHYVRYDDSMTNSYDMNRYQQLEVFYESLEYIADETGFIYRKSLNSYILSNMLDGIKKTIELNPNGFLDTVNAMIKIRNAKRFDTYINEKVSTNNAREKVMLFLVKYRMYLLVYSIIKIVNAFRNR